MNYYEPLGVSKDASSSDIKKAFKKKAMKYHPDRNAGDKESEKQFFDNISYFRPLLADSGYNLHQQKSQTSLPKPSEASGST